MQRLLIFALIGLVALALSGAALAAPAKPVATATVAATATAKATVAPTATQSPKLVPTATPKLVPTATPKPRLQPTPTNESPRWWGKYRNAKDQVIWVGSWPDGCPQTHAEFTHVTGTCTQTRPY